MEGEDLVVEEPPCWCARDGSCGDALDFLVRVWEDGHPHVFEVSNHSVYVESVACSWCYFDIAKVEPVCLWVIILVEVWFLVRINDALCYGFPNLGVAEVAVVEDSCEETDCDDGVFGGSGFEVPTRGACEEEIFGSRWGVVPVALWIGVQLATPFSV